MKSDRDVGNRSLKSTLCGKSPADCLINSIGTNKRFSFETLSETREIGTIRESQVNLSFATMRLVSDELPVALVVVADLMLGKQLFYDSIAGEKTMNSPVSNADLDSFFAEGINRVSGVLFHI